MEKIKDEMFGLLILDKYEEVYKGIYIIDNNEISILIDSELVKELDFFKEFIKNYNNNFERIKKEKFNDILKLKNEEWLDNDEKELTLKELLSRIELETIEFYGYCSVSLRFNDGGVFFGRYINIDVRGFHNNRFIVSFNLK